MTSRRAVLVALAGLAGTGSMGFDADRAPAERREDRPEGAEELAAFVRENRRAVEHIDLPDRRRECRGCGGLAELEAPGRVRCFECGPVETDRI